MNDPSKMIRELDDRWILGLRGMRVESAAFAQFALLILEGGAEIAFNDGAVISKGSVKGDGYSFEFREKADEGLGFLVGAEVLSAVAFKSGSLRVVFDSGWHLNVRSSDDGAYARVRVPGVLDWTFRYPDLTLTLE